MRSLELRSRDGVTFRARDGVTLGPRDGVTSDVTGGLPPIPSSGTSLRIKNLAPAQDVDLPLCLIRNSSTLVGEDRGVDYGGPRSDLKLAFWRAIDGQSAAVAYQKGLGGFDGFSPKGNSPWPLILDLRSA